MVAFGAEGSDDKEKYLKIGEELAHTCHESYARTGRSCCAPGGGDLFYLMITDSLTVANLVPICTLPDRCCRHRQRQKMLIAWF